MGGTAILPAPQSTARFRLILPALNSAQFWVAQAIGRAPFVPLSIAIGSFRIVGEDICWPLNSSAILDMLLNRVIEEFRERRRLAGELEAARIVQRLLLPGTGSPGTIESEAVYEPAREVGADYYRISGLGNGSRIVLVGDVSGNGLEAAMLASVAVAAFRYADSGSPAAARQGLNQALSGHGRSGFVTCCCARFEAGLALGVAPGAVYSETFMTLPLNSHVTLISDGVVEAANANGELFGFDRACEISGRSAKEIAAAAKSCGQNDGITVLTVRRMK